MPKPTLDGTYAGKLSQFPLLLRLHLLAIHLRIVLLF